MIPLVQLWHSQTSLIFPGAAATQGQPDAVVVPGPDSELVHLQTAKGVNVVAEFGAAQDVEGRVLPDAATRPTVVYFHGNGSCLADCAAEFGHFRRLGVNALFPEYQGYGMSEGKPGEAGCYATADAALEHLMNRPDIDPNRIILAGRSLGSAVAIDLASRRPEIAGLIAISPFTSMGDMGRRTYPGLPTHLLLRHHFDSLAKIPKVACPILVVHGARDTFVPPEMARRLAAAARSRVTQICLSAANHSNVMEVSGSVLWNNLDNFLRQFDPTPLLRSA